MNIDEWKLQLKQLCQKAINGSITIEEFHNQWPSTSIYPELGRLIYEDLEEGVEHFPAKLFSGTLDFDVWKKSESYRRVMVDNEILSYPYSEANLIKLRKEKLRDI